MAVFRVIIFSDNPLHIERRCLKDITEQLFHTCPSGRFTVSNGVLSEPTMTEGIE